MTRSTNKEKFKIKFTLIKLLILGGTNFIGRNLINQLITLNQFDITLYNRGVTNAHLFPALSKLYGDRNTDPLTKVAEGRWDYVIDLSCYYPDSLEKVLAALDGRCKRYIFVSTCSVYDSEAEKSVLRDETAPILPCTPDQRNDPSPSTYGQRKAECERILQQSGLDFVIFRPALVYGPYDPTDRLYYWLYQAKKNDPILLPDEGKKTFSVTYVADLVKAIIDAISIEHHQSIYTMTSSPQTSIRQLVTTASELLHRSPNSINAPPAFLHAQHVTQWTDMPLWIDNDYFTYSNERLKADFGFTPIDFQESIQQTIIYYNNRGWDAPIYGMTEARKQELMNQLV